MSAEIDISVEKQTYQFRNRHLHADIETLV